MKFYIDYLDTEGELYEEMWDVDSILNIRQK